MHNVDWKIMNEQQEIERKFIVANDSWRNETDGTKMILNQVYIANIPEVSIRVATRVLYQTHGDPLQRANINIKMPRDGLVRSETELELEWTQGVLLIELLRNKYPSIEKARHFVSIDGFKKPFWEIDCFLSKGLQDLVIAEIELPNADYPDLVLPNWIGREVTNDPLYYNAVLAERLQVPDSIPCNKEIEQNFIDHWSFLLNSDGSVNLDQLKLELSDFSFLIREVPKVYDHVAGLSKHMYEASTITTEADRRYWEMHRDIILDDIADMTTVDEIREYLDFEIYE